MNRIAAQVAQRKARRPELYCPEPRCLWHTGGGWCPRHTGQISPLLAAAEHAAPHLGEPLELPANPERPHPYSRRAR